MDTRQDQDASERISRSKVYFIVAIVLLFLLALLWSVSASFVYILLGGAVFFLVLALRSRNGIQFGAKSREHRNQTSAFQEDLKYLFKKQKKASPSVSTDSGTGTIDQKASRRVIMFTLLFILSVFSIILTAVVFLSRGSYSTDATSSYQRGDEFYWNAQYDSAYHNYKLALQEEPEYTDAWYSIGNVMLVNNQYDSALFYFNKALELDPDFSKAAYGKCQVYYNQQNYSDAVREAAALLERDPNYYDALLLTGDSYYVQKQYDSAIIYYEDAYEMGARSKELSYIMAYIYDEQGNVSKAIPLYQETLRYDSSVMDIYKRLGELLPGEDGDYYRQRVAGQQW